MLTIYNTLTREKETFTPLNPPHVGVYICGVTVYDDCHLGHARTYTSADVIIRYLRYAGYKVKYIRNITDIDDKIIKRAQENQEDYKQLTERVIKGMNDNFNALGFVKPDAEPRATEFIPQMIALIEKIIANKHGYVADNGDVYFDVRSFPNYGCLSHHNLEQLESGARVEVVDVKHDPLDFVLWKLAKANEPSWDSPWGKGRPGWHIECSAMAMQLLGEQFDMHGGGRDLIFPHHENEIAQAEAVTKKQFAKTWVHGGFLQIDKEKMSKSLGNFITINDLLKDHQPEVLRYFLMASHYRSPLIYTDTSLTQAKQALTRFYTALRFLPNASLPSDSPFMLKFKEAMDDDFNTPIALSVLFDLAHEIQRVRQHDLNEAASLGALLKELGSILGILQQDPEVFFQAGSEIDAARVEQLISARNEARKNKDWSEADKIRKTLTEMGVAIEDGAEGTTWKRLI